MFQDELTIHAIYQSELEESVNQAVTDNFLYNNNAQYDAIDSAILGVTGINIQTLLQLQLAERGLV